MMNSRLMTRVWLTAHRRPARPIRPAAMAGPGRSERAASQWIDGAGVCRPPGRRWSVCLMNDQSHSHVHSSHRGTGHRQRSPIGSAGCLDRIKLKSQHMDHGCMLHRRSALLRSAPVRRPASGCLVQECASMQSHAKTGSACDLAKALY